MKKLLSAGKIYLHNVNHIWLSFLKRFGPQSCLFLLLFSFLPIKCLLNPVEPVISKVASWPRWLVQTYFCSPLSPPRHSPPPSSCPEARSSSCSPRTCSWLGRAPQLWWRLTRFYQISCGNILLKLFNSQIFTNLNASTRLSNVISCLNCLAIIVRNSLNSKVSYILTG